MKTTTLAVLNASLLTAASVLLLPVATTSAWPTSPVAQDGKAAAPKTEDVIHMSDGRVLHGQIISETRDQVVFEYRDAKLNMTTKLTLKTDDIAQIDRDVPLEGVPSATTGSADSTENGDAIAPVQSTTKEAGALTESGMRFARSGSSDPTVPSLYILPMKGQMGTDIRSEVYDEVIAEIKRLKPTLVIIEMNCSDTTDLMYPDGYDQRSDAELEEIREREWGMMEFENYREMVGKFRDGLRETKQVVWIHDSDGIAATVAMAWDQLFISPDGRLGAKISPLDRSGAKNWQDSDVRAKMMAAWMGIAQSFLEKGGYSTALAQSMVDSSPKLSGSWKGREMQWQMNDEGQYVVDQSDRHSAYFTAKTAEDFCVSDGTAETLDDLALLHGFREYRVLESKAADGISAYVQDWRRSYRNCEKWLREFQEDMALANGEDAVRYLGKAKSTLERIVSAINRYKAVEIRLGSDFGVNKVDLTARIEQIGEQIRSIKGSSGGGGSGGGRTGGRGGGMGNPGG